MITFYNQWLAFQDEWTRKLDANAKQILYRYLVAMPIISIAALVLIGMAMIPEAALTLDSLKNGIFLGAVLDLVCLLVLVPSLPGRRCRRQLRRTVDRLLDTEFQRESFAQQMLGHEDSETRCISWVDQYTDGNRVWVTKDYVMKISGTGQFQLVCLKAVEQIKSDSRLRAWTLGRRDLRLRCRRRTYIIDFRYRPADRQKSRWYERFRGGPRITFRSQQTRDQVMEALAEMNEERSCEKIP